MKKQTIIIKVIPFAKENNIKEEIDLFSNTVYKIRTAAAPQDGQANDAVIEMIAKHFKVAKRKIRILKGLTSRNKVVEIG